MTRESHDFVHTFSASVSLMENLLNYRNPLVMDRLPPYLLQYRLLLKELCGRSKSDNNLQQNQVQKLADCGHKLEKLTKALVRCTKDMSRISMYLIADILKQYEVSALDPSVKVNFDRLLVVVALFLILNFCFRNIWITVYTVWSHCVINTRYSIWWEFWVVLRLKSSRWCINIIKNIIDLREKCKLLPS